MKCFHHLSLSAATMLLASSSIVEARIDNLYLPATRQPTAATVPTSSSLVARIRGGATLSSQRPKSPSSLPMRTTRTLSFRHERANEETTVIESGVTVILDDDDAAATKKARILQGITFLFVLSFSVTALAPAPALIAALGAEKATTLLSLVTGGGALTEILFSSRVGSLLDSEGRKPAFVLVLAVVVTMNAIVAMHGSTTALCLSKFFSILSMTVFTLSSQAVMSDLSETVATPEKWLSSTIGANMASSGMGFFAGVIMAGILSDKRGGGLVTTYTISATIAAIATLFATWFLPETLPAHKRTATTSSSPVSARQRLRHLLEAPLASTKLLFRHGPQVRTLAIILMLLNLPMFQGDMFQVYSKQEWKLDTKSLSSYLALYGLVGIFANGCGSFLIQRIGTKHFTLLAIISRLISTSGAAFFGYKGAVVGILIGFLGAAQTIGIIAALVSAGTKSGLPQGELAGERSSLMALLKVVGPFLYSFLYIRGSGGLGMPNLPFVFNIFVSIVALIATQLYLK